MIIFKLITKSQFDVIIFNKSLRVEVFNLIPKSIINNILLIFPRLYKLKIINYETVLSLNDGISEIILKIDQTKNIKGNIIECGAARCGTSVIMGNHLKKTDSKKIVYACDSFEGFNKDEIIKEREKGLTKALESAFTYTSYDYIVKKIKRLKLDRQIIPVKGFFHNTLSNIDSKFSLALIDADLEESICQAADSAWPKLSSGGVMLFDEYNNRWYEGAKIAIDRFVSEYESEFEEHYMMKRLYYVKKK